MKLKTRTPGELVKVNGPVYKGETLTGVLVAAKAATAD
jgi:hypothetical protein